MLLSSSVLGPLSKKKEKEKKEKGSSVLGIVPFLSLASFCKVIAFHFCIILHPCLFKPLSLFQFCTHLFHRTRDEAVVIRITTFDLTYDSFSVCAWFYYVWIKMTIWQVLWPKALACCKIVVIVLQLFYAFLPGWWPSSV